MITMISLIVYFIIIVYDWLNLKYIANINIYPFDAKVGDKIKFNTTPVMFSLYTYINRKK